MEQIKIDLIKQVVDLAVKVNVSNSQAIVEIEIDGYSLEVFIYAGGVNGDEVDKWKIKLKHHNFDNKIDEVIDRLKELLSDI